jgi:hypothetical protein
MAFKSVSCNFLDDKKTQVYEELLPDMFSLYLSVLIWFISKEINHQVSGRYEESFHYDIALMERRRPCKGKWREATYNCRFLLASVSSSENNQKKKRANHSFFLMNNYDS